MPVRSLTPATWSASQGANHMHSAQDRAGRNPFSRRTQSDRTALGQRANASCAAESFEQLEVGPGQNANPKTARWQYRSTLLLIVSVGVIFWGGVWWLIFG